MHTREWERVPLSKLFEELSPIKNYLVKRTRIIVSLPLSRQSQRLAKCYNFMTPISAFQLGDLEPVRLTVLCLIVSSWMEVVITMRLIGWRPKLAFLSRCLIFYSLHVSLAKHTYLYHRLKASTELWWPIRVPCAMFLLQGQLFSDPWLAMLHQLRASPLQTAAENTLFY